MMARRRRELLYEVLGGKRAALHRRGDMEPSRPKAAAGALVAVGLLIAVAAGAYAWSARTTGGGGSPALAATRWKSASEATLPKEAAPGAAPERRAEASPTPAAAETPAARRPRYVIQVKTVRWENAAGRKAAEEEARAVVEYLDKVAKLPEVHAVRVPNKDAYVVYVGAADDPKQLAGMLGIVKKLRYKTTRDFDSAFVLKRPVG
ncbi:MAG TPA: hypothetical protein VEI02_14655 [Planctomycetota bacterium]|nr:hypothetical protein [Planctomycetota bacterium]